MPNHEVEQKKNEKLQKKLRKIVPIFATCCHISEKKIDTYPQNCNYLLTKSCSSNRGLFNTHLGAVKQNKSQKTAKFSPKISKIHEKPPN